MEGWAYCGCLCVSISLRRELLSHIFLPIQRSSPSHTATLVSIEPPNHPHRQFPKVHSRGVLRQCLHFITRLGSSLRGESESETSASPMILAPTASMLTRSAELVDIGSWRRWVPTRVRYQT